MERTIVEARHAASTGNAGETVGAGVLDIFGFDLVPAIGGAINQLIGLRFAGLDLSSIIT